MSEESLYARLAKEGKLERSSCVPVAFAAATGLDYQSSLYLFAALGRRRSCGTTHPVQREAARILGLKTEVVENPPRRVREAVNMARNWNHGALVYVRGHVFFTKNGIIHDWIDKNRRHRVVNILKITGFVAPAPELHDLIEKGREKYQQAKNKKASTRKRRSTLEKLKDDFGWEDVKEFKGTYGRAWYITANGVRYRLHVRKARLVRDTIIKKGGIEALWKEKEGSYGARIDECGVRHIYSVA